MRSVLRRGVALRSSLLNPATASGGPDPADRRQRPVTAHLSRPIMLARSSGRTVPDRRVNDHVGGAHERRVDAQARDAHNAATGSSSGAPSAGCLNAQYAAVTKVESTKQVASCGRSSAVSPPPDCPRPSRNTAAPSPLPSPTAATPTATSSPPPSAPPCCCREGRLPRRWRRRTRAERARARPSASRRGQRPAPRP